MSTFSQLRRWLIRTPMMLRIVLAAYLLMAMGVLTWTPALWLQTDAQHQVYVTDQGGVISWISHHLESSDQANTPAHDATQPHQQPDHVLDVPSLDQPLTAQKYFNLIDLAVLPILLIFLLAFLTLYRYPLAQKIVRLCDATTPLRNSIAILTRTTVLRH